MRTTIYNASEPRRRSARLNALERTFFVHRSRAKNCDERARPQLFTLIRLSQL